MCGGGAVGGAVWGGGLCVWCMCVLSALGEVWKQGDKVEAGEVTGDLGEEEGVV